jgi:hypothetical protein
VDSISLIDQKLIELSEDTREVSQAITTNLIIQSDNTIPSSLKADAIIDIKDEAPGLILNTPPIISVLTPGPQGATGTAGPTGPQGPAGASSSPGGSDTEIQYRNAGAFGADGSFTFFKSPNSWAFGGPDPVGGRYPSSRGLKTSLAMPARPTGVSVVPSSGGTFNGTYLFHLFNMVVTPSGWGLFGTGDGPNYMNLVNQKVTFNWTPNNLYDAILITCLNPDGAAYVAAYLNSLGTATETAPGQDGGW